MSNQEQIKTKNSILQRLLSRCIDDVDELTDLGKKFPHREQIYAILNKNFDDINEKLQDVGRPLISESEKSEVAYKLEKRGAIVRPEDATIILSGGGVPAWIADAKIDWRYWENYKNLLLKEGKSRSVISEHEIAIDQALELSGDPNKADLGTRKGLVMGNVQSGKTLNFIGLINKALDAGYHTIIVLGGHMNELRAQAQARINQGVIDIHELSSSLLHKIQNVPHTLTTVDEDFNKRKASGLKLNLSVIPAIYVVKKMPSILDRLVDWFEDASGDSVLSKPLLLIDDEADYASINTLHSKSDFSRTNQTIRNLLGKFERSTYVAYTATPFANVFIPFIDKSIEKELDDLFPSDFMIKMPVPPDYYGQDFFFNESEPDSENSPCRILDSESQEEWLKLKHKKTDEISELNEKLEEAIYAFLSVIAIRHLRGQSNSHNTMLVNVSRFNILQQSLGLLIQDFIRTVHTQLRAYGGLSEDKACQQSRHISALRVVFRREYSSSGFRFSEILEFLATECVQRFVSVEVVNGESRKSKNSPKLLDYEGNDTRGLWVIAVGGLKLSRGLTLEGLSISYFYRNALAYDTLTQMCRWFGYRPRYEDLCRLYLLRSSHGYYVKVADAIRGLYNDLERMRLENGTPRDYGLRVKNSEPALLITAKNKLGTAKSFLFSYRFWATSVDGLRLKDDDKINDSNLALAKVLVEKSLVSNNRSKASSSTIVETSYDDLVDFMKKVSVSYPDKRVQSHAVVNAIRGLRRNGFTAPKILVFSRNKGTTNSSVKEVITEDGSPAAVIGATEICGIPVTMITRTMQINASGEIYNPNKSISDSDDLRTTLNDIQIEYLKDLKKGKFDNSDIREYCLESPVLVLYLFRAIVTRGDKKYFAHRQPSVAFSLHFPAQPKSGKPIQEMDTTVEYLINEVLQDATFDEANDEDEDETIKR